MAPAANGENLKHAAKVQLKELQDANQALMTAYILKYDLKDLWRYKRESCEDANGTPVGCGDRVGQGIPDRSIDNSGDETVARPSSPIRQVGVSR